jgi:hypothetical protein
MILSFAKHARGQTQLILIWKMVIFSFEKKEFFFGEVQSSNPLTIFFTPWMGGASHLDLVWCFNWFIFQKNYVIVALHGWVGSN